MFCCLNNVGGSLLFVALSKSNENTNFLILSWPGSFPMKYPSLSLTASTVAVYYCRTDSRSRRQPPNPQDHLAFERGWLTVGFVTGAKQLGSLNVLAKTQKVVEQIKCQSFSFNTFTHPVQIC